MAYYDKFKSGSKDKRSFSEDKSERRYARTNRYSADSRSGLDRPGHGAGKPAYGTSQSKFGNQRFEGRNDRDDHRNSDFQGDVRSVKADRPFGRKKPDGNRSFDRSFKNSPAERTRFKPQPDRFAPSTGIAEPAAAEQDENLLFGRNPIREALKAGRDIEKMLVSEGDLSGSAKEILSMARKANIKIQMVEKSQLDKIARNHQGMIAIASAYRYAEVEDMLALADDKGEEPFLIVLDQITDPHNLGAIIRTAACCGAHGVIIPRHRAVGLTATAVKTSSGAVEYVKVARVTNIAQTLKQLKQKNIWAFAADMAGRDYRQADFSVGTALVIGSEGEGISPVVRSQCDDIVSIPMVGEIASMNASVAAGILMHAVYCARAR